MQTSTVKFVQRMDDEMNSDELIKICDGISNVIENRDMDQCDDKMYLNMIAYSLLAIAKELKKLNDIRVLGPDPEYK